MTDMTVERVELVDRNGASTGTSTKLAAHQPPGQLHRAVSVILFDDYGRVLLQRRAQEVYHFADRWSNTCCTHPRPGERPVDTASRRLIEEMGVSAELTEAGSFFYKAEDPASGLVENEYDHVFLGRFTGIPRPDDGLVSDWTWAENETIEQQYTADPTPFTPWLPKVLDLARRHD